MNKHLRQHPAYRLYSWVKEYKASCVILSFIAGSILFSFSSCKDSVTWEPVEEKLMTPWGEQIDPGNVLPEYPRPQMERSDWFNLNGLWNYAILPKGASIPETFDGQILVPFPVESALSGVKKKVGIDYELWYSRKFRIPAAWNGKTIKLNFGGIDWKADVWINKQFAGSHAGGYAPFSLDITPYLKRFGSQEVIVRVWDPTEKGTQPIGKQRSEYFEVWYRPVTGIWQTVWLEPVFDNHILSVRITPDIDRETVLVSVETNKPTNKDIAEIIISDGKEEVVVYSGYANRDSHIKLSNPRLWSPDDPFLYDLKVSIIDESEVMDEIKSYFGMRKISRKKDPQGLMRITLNNQFLFNYGPLDQGFWPDGIYTAPADSALIWDVAMTKKLGFNMIRKHVKTEPQRWYYHCDRLGMLVWQDMPNGDRKAEWQGPSGIDGKEITRSEESELQYRREWKEIMDYLYSHPSVVVWVPFNEGWGQFKTVEMLNWTKEYDPSRLVDGPSGGNHFPVGDIIDHHQYPGPAMPELVSDRAMVLGEFGALPLQIKKHSWYEETNFSIKTREELTEAYIEICTRLKLYIAKGLSGAVYCQTTDIEGVWREDNGFFTYDRKVVKVLLDETYSINREIVCSLDTLNNR